jgi:hypothetical protein
MSDYTHPYRDTTFVLKELVEFEALCASAHLDDVNDELVSAILAEAGRLGSGVLAPLNRIGDTKARA